MKPNPSASTNLRRFVQLKQMLIHIAARQQVLLDLVLDLAQNIDAPPRLDVNAEIALRLQEWERATRPRASGQTGGRTQRAKGRKKKF